MNAASPPVAGGISPALLEAVCAQVERDGLSEALVYALRRDWPGVHFTACAADDVPARLRPARAGAGFELYLVGGADHCVAFTDHLEAATGLVLALSDDDD